MMIPILAAAAAILIATAATAQATDPHAGHGTAGSTPTSPSDAMSGMDHSTMAGMNMAPIPKGIAHRIGGPAEAALQAFSDAVEVGNRELAIERLAPEVRIVENGVEEDFASYVGGHLASDMAFQKTVKTILLDRQVRHDGDRATIISKSRLMSNRSDKAIDIVVGEIATLAKSRAGWKIVKLVWNSGPNPR